jgi:hypothetical protein
MVILKRNDYAHLEFLNKNLLKFVNQNKHTDWLMDV